VRAPYLAIVFAFCLIPTSLPAGTAYSNFGPGNTFSNSNITISAAFTATTFTTTAGGMLATVQLALGSPTTPVTMGLYTDSAGHPGTVLENWTVPVAPLPQLITLTSVLNPALSSGTQYWFVLSNPSNLIWSQNNQGVIGGVWVGPINTLTQNLAFLPTPAIQLLTQGTPNPTPLPPTLILTLCGLALAGLAWFVAKKRTGSASAA